MRSRATPSSSASMQDHGGLSAPCPFSWIADLDKNRAVGLRVDDGRAEIDPLRAQAHAAITHRQSDPVPLVPSPLPCAHRASFSS